MCLGLRGEGQRTPSAVALEVFLAALGERPQSSPAMTVIVEQIFNEHYD